MSDYTKSTNFASKDSLSVGNPLKIVKGTEIDTEFNNIATAVATKADLASPTLTGVPAAPTAAVGTNTTQVANTAFVVAQIANDAPTKTGTGASGNWPINVTGSSATVTTITKSQVLNQIAATAAPDIGSYMFLLNQTGSTVSPNGTAGGTNLAYASVQTSGGLNWNGNSTGTWKAMGFCPNGNATLWLRIS